MESELSINDIKDIDDQCLVKQILEFGKKYKDFDLQYIEKYNEHLLVFGEFEYQQRSALLRVVNTWGIPINKDKNETVHDRPE